jgi:hypothetical protein
MFNQFSHATCKVGKFKDDHVPTCMLDNMTNLPSQILDPYFTWKCLAMKMLEDISKSFTNVGEHYFALLEQLVHGSVP